MGGARSEFVTDRSVSCGFVTMTRLRQVVGAHQGLNFWVGQLATAVIMLIGLIYLLVVYALITPVGYAELVAFISADYVRVPASLFALALIWHAWLGAKSILMDYIKWTWYRILKYFSTFIYLGLCLAWFLGVVWTN